MIFIIRYREKKFLQKYLYKMTQITKNWDIFCLFIVFMIHLSNNNIFHNIIHHYLIHIINYIIKYIDDFIIYHNQKLKLIIVWFLSSSIFYLLLNLLYTFTIIIPLNNYIYFIITGRVKNLIMSFNIFSHKYSLLS